MPKVVPQLDYRNFGKRMKTFRGIHGISLKKLSEMTGVEDSVLSRYERLVVRNPSYTHCLRIARVIGISLDTIYEPLDTEKHLKARTAIELLSARSHAIAVSKEWWVDFDNAPKKYKPFILAVKIALVITEVSEALEAARDGKYTMYAVGDKPEGVVVELADAIIRIFDLCEKLGLDLKTALLEKLDYNETRPIKHGNKVF